MTKVNTGLELKNVIVGLHIYQLQQLQAFCEEEGVSRSEVIRNAVDLWLRAKQLSDEKKEVSDDGGN